MPSLACVCCLFPCELPRTIVCAVCGDFLARIQRGERPDAIFNTRGQYTEHREAA